MVIGKYDVETYKLVAYVIEHIKIGIDYIIMRPSSEVSVANLPV